MTKFANDTLGEVSNPEPRILITKRLTLRPVLEVDAEDTAYFLQEHDVVRWLTSVPYPYTYADALSFTQQQLPKWLRDEDYAFAIVRERMIGSISIRRNGNLGYWLAKPYWGEGLMSEALAAVIVFAFDHLPRDVLTARVAMDNEASQQVLLKAGFIATGDVGECLVPSLGRALPSVGFQLTRQAFKASCGDQ